MDSSEPSMNSLGEKILPQPILPEHLCYCPTMDLVALVTIDDQTHVHRLNGQKVFTVHKKRASAKVVQLAWKPNGSLLAVAFDDSSVVLVSVQTGKAVHEIQRDKLSSSRITSLGWGVNSTDPKALQGALAKKDLKEEVEEALNRGLKASGIHVPFDLPTDLAFLDFTDVLPKLSPLPMGGNEDEAFSTQTSMDAIFRPSKKDANDTTDVLLVGFEDGTNYLSIHDFFEIGVFNLQDTFPHHRSLSTVLHRFRPFSSTHTLLVKSQDASHAEQLSFVPLDLRLIPETGKYLSLLASKSTQLLNLLRYVKEIQRQVHGEFQNSQDLPNRFMRNVDEALQETKHCSWRVAAYHCICTGDCYKAMKEWLVDELGDRGHKRWDKAVTTAYETIRRLTHQNLLPALERFSTSISRLRGLARFQEFMVPLGLDTQSLNDVFDTLNCLMLLAHHILITSSAELKGFQAFSSWLKQEIEVQALDPEDPGYDELMDKDPGLDYGEVLRYVDGAMGQSRLVELLGLQGEGDGRRGGWGLEGMDGKEVYEEYRKAMRVFAEGKVPERKVPALKALIERLDRQCRGVFERIAETQKRKVRFGEGTPLGVGRVLRVDMRLVVEPWRTLDETTTYVAVVFAKSPQRMELHRLTLDITNGHSSLRAHYVGTIVFPSTSNIKDIKFVDDESLMLALELGESSHILSMPYTSFAETPFADYARNPSSIVPHDLTDASSLTAHIRHTFASSQSPTQAIERLEVNGRKARRVVCVLAGDRLRLRFFDVDAQDEGEEEVGEEEGEEGGEGMSEGSGDRMELED